VFFLSGLATPHHFVTLSSPFKGIFMDWRAAQRHYDLGRYGACKQALSSVGYTRAATSELQIEQAVEQLALRANRALCDFHAAKAPLHKAAGSRNSNAHELMQNLNQVFDGLEGAPRKL
jgi:hypothetical protein